MLTETMTWTDDSQIAPPRCEMPCCELRRRLAAPEGMLEDWEQTRRDLGLEPSDA